ATVGTIHVHIFEGKEGETDVILPPNLRNIKYNHLITGFYVDHSNFHFDVLDALLNEKTGDAEIFLNWYHRTKTIDISNVKKWLLTFPKSRILSLEIVRIKDDSIIYHQYPDH
ncbi:hypothetical protein PFISCL1PPCAC_11793, partial [Pristionchus fissidentatus]